MLQDEAALRTRFEDHFFSLPFLHENERLYLPLQHALGQTGKWLRPLCALVVQSSFATVNDEGLALATALELFHNFTLIHDDIIDRSSLRRGAPSVFHKFGLNASILSGDALLILAYRQIEQIQEQYRSEVFALFNRTAMKVCLGQQMDIDFENETQINLQQYMQMINLKTAALIGCAFRMGGILCRMTQNEKDALYAIGQNIGIAFQIQDDILDAYGDPQKTGKMNYTDITNGKKNILMTLALANATDEQRNILLAPAKTPAQIEQVLNIFATHAVEQRANEHLHHYERECQQQLSTLPREKTGKIRGLLKNIMGHSF